MLGATNRESRTFFRWTPHLGASLLLLEWHTRVELDALLELVSIALKIIIKSVVT
jgi:hypothetical protein